jgi:arylesterase/paraoxonase
LLYLACSTLENRGKWLPNADIFDLVNRPDTDYLAIYDTKGSGSAASRKTVIKPSNFKGTNGKGSYNLHGMGVHMIDEETLRIFLINHRPQADPHTNGANSTVELFESTLGSDTMRHIKTYADEVIMTPNDLTPTGPDSFVFSNDHHIKVGHLKVLDLFMARTSVGRCDNKGCKKVIEPYKYPNGITGVSQLSPTVHFLNAYISTHRARNFPIPTPTSSTLPARHKISLLWWNRKQMEVWSR